MINESDSEFLNRINAALKQSNSLSEAVDKLGENYSTVYTRIAKLGYQVSRELCLVPMHAPALDELGDDQREAAA